MYERVEVVMPRKVQLLVLGSLDVVIKLIDLWKAYAEVRSICRIRFLCSKGSPRWKVPSHPLHSRLTSSSPGSGLMPDVGFSLNK